MVTCRNGGADVSQHHAGATDLTAEGSTLAEAFLAPSLFPVRSE